MGLCGNLTKAIFKKKSYSGKSKMKGISRIVFVRIDAEADTRQQNNKKNIVKTNLKCSVILQKCDARTGFIHC